MYEPFLDDPKHIKTLDAQRFVVLRAPLEFSSAYREFQNKLRVRFRDLPVSFPAQPHVTLCGFAAGTTVGDLEPVLRQWAAATRPLSLEVSGNSWLPAPFQIVIQEIKKTAALYHALTSLRTLAGDQNLNISSLVSAEQWRFHMTLAYCSELTEMRWQELLAFLESSPLPARTSAFVDAAELVAFDAGKEYSGGTFRFGCD